MRKIFSWFVICIFVGLLALAFIPEPVSAMTGSGTAEDPYMVYNVTDLQNMQNHLNAYYELANDIDASATETWNWDAGRGVYEGFVPISAFTGDFAGNYCTISNLYMDRSGESYVGLFADATDSYIRNLYILDADIEAEYTAHIGILAGYAGAGTFYRVIVSGDIYGSGTDVAAGGIIGAAYVAGPYRLTIRQCASYVDVAASGIDTARAGGIAGYGTIVRIYDSYARGPVNAGEAGGILGRGGTGTILTNCYATGYMTGSPKGGLVAYYGNSVTASFWDIETTGCTSSSMGGTGKTTIEMKTESTFTDAGWDFDNIWGMGGCVNDGYPYFDWWYDPPPVIDDIYQVVWFQPNAIIQGTTLPNRAEEEDGIITWGANPAGITMSHSLLQPEEDYEFEPIIPETADIIRPEPGGMTGDVDLEKLENNPFNPLVQAIVSVGGFTARLVWLGIAWFILIAVMIAIQLKTHHMMLTGIAGFGLASLFYVMGIFPLWVVIVFGMGMVASIIYERMTVL